jgi:MFS family permease
LSGVAPARDLRLLFVTRAVRMVGYGGLAVVLVLYLSELGFDAARIGLMLTLTLVGDALISLLLTIRADRFGRRRTLVVGAALLVVAALVFAVSQDFVVLLIAATLGVISPSGNEVGPFLPVEQAALSQIVPDRERTHTLAWYQLVGALASALGALGAGVLVQVVRDAGWSVIDGYRAVVIGYGAIGLAIGALVWPISSAVEVSSPPETLATTGARRERRDPGASRAAGGEAAPAEDPTSIRRRFGLHRSRRVVADLSALFALDAFGGGFVVLSLVAWWFHLRWQVDPAALGAILFGANALAGLSGLVAARLAARFGLVATMVGTHLPSNVMLILVPLMPSAQLAAALLLVRFAISQMDVPTRQSYTMAVVDPDERSAAAGWTGMARSAGAAAAPVLATPLVTAPVLLGGLPFVIAGGLKIVYDIALWLRFRSVRPPEEVAASGSTG